MLLCSSVGCMCFFFFKQKTAYDMRISDWSSDVCSSDLIHGCAVTLKTGGEVDVAEQSARMPVGNAGFGQIGVHRGCTDADQHRVIMSVQAFGGTHVERGVAAQSLADQMRLNGCGGEDHGHAHVVLIDIQIRRGTCGEGGCKCGYLTVVR